MEGMVTGTVGNTGTVFFGEVETVRGRRGVLAGEGRVVDFFDFLEACWARRGVIASKQ